jgi:hypothetical protein
LLHSHTIVARTPSPEDGGAKDGGGEERESREKSEGKGKGCRQLSR